jgi:hypothetical protein
MLLFLVGIQGLERRPEWKVCLASIFL